eukprot:CAMPEP_0116055018 /NCGR_PEP_ID=MMETSP0322-20121206/3150_1 /TAXON_ID=163516 /ORGANISM="Leptocylindrus danicus var. apora, Strain B651" /LENGTH=178 /DNA_ID=CAMNT_0003538527 /DNA_START=236 /DNA_END=772 /DNA_ORIENTATION=+
MQSIFGGIGSKYKSFSEVKRRNELCLKLLETCRSGEKDRKVINEIVEELSLLNPTSSPSISSLLEKDWRLEWTTEKEINLFSDWNLSDEISQSIVGSNMRNLIVFKNGGNFSVDVELGVDDVNPLRTNFEFVSAALELNGLNIRLPPVGEGWFDTLYLDENLRVQTNSRNDLFVFSLK